MPGVDPRGMAPPLLGLEPAKIFVTVPLQHGFLSVIARRRRAGAATRHANRQSLIAVTGPTDGARPQLPPAFRARGPGEPRCRHHGVFATPSRTRVLSSPSRFSAAAAPTRRHSSGASVFLSPMRPVLSAGQRSSGASHLPSFPRLPAPPETRTHCAAAPHLAPAPLPRPRSIPVTPQRGARQASGSPPGTPTAAGGPFSG